MGGVVDCLSSRTGKAGRSGRSSGAVCQQPQGSRFSRSSGEKGAIFRWIYN